MTQISSHILSVIKTLPLWEHIQKFQLLPIISSPSLNFPFHVTVVK